METDLEKRIRKLESAVYGSEAKPKFTVVDGVSFKSECDIVSKDDDGGAFIDEKVLAERYILRAHSNLKSILDMAKEGAAGRNYIKEYINAIGIVPLLESINKELEQ